MCSRSGTSQWNRGSERRYKLKGVSIQTTKATLALLVSISCLAAELVHFENGPHRYQADYPSGWIEWHDRGDLEIANYKPEQGLRGGLLSPGGARIQVTVKPEKLASKTLEEWVQRDLSVVDPGELVSRTRASVGKVCLEAHVRYEAGPGVIYEQYSCYFESGRRQFAVGLEYRQGDSQASKYRLAYEMVVRSFRAH